MSTHTPSPAPLPASGQPITGPAAERIVANLHGGDTVIADATAEHPEVHAGYLQALAEITRHAGLSPARRRLFKPRPVPSTTSAALNEAVAQVYARASSDYRQKCHGADRAPGLAYGAAAALAQVHTRGSAGTADLLRTLDAIHDGLRANDSWSATAARLPTPMG